MLEEAECDVLILLDCCAAASSGGNHGRGVTEVIAACGFEAFAPGVGEHSFTRSLIDELKYLNQRCNATSTALLHNKVLARIKKSWNPRYSTNGLEERRRTPIYIHLSDDTKQRCITLAPLQPFTHWTISSQPLQASSSSLSDPSTSASEDVSMVGSDETSQSEVWPDKKFKLPKVLISVSLQEDQRLDPEHWLEWLKSIPALADLVEVEGIFKSDSTLLLLTLPVALWDSIPRDPAVTFLAFVRSHNLRNHSRSPASRVKSAVPPPHQPFLGGSLGTFGIKPNLQSRSPFSAFYQPVYPGYGEIKNDTIDSLRYTHVVSPAPSASTSSTDGSDMLGWQSKSSLSSADSGSASGLDSDQSPEQLDTLLPDGFYGPDNNLPPLASGAYPPLPADYMLYARPNSPQTGNAAEKSVQESR